MQGMGGWDAQFRQQLSSKRQSADARQDADTSTSSRLMLRVRRCITCILLVSYLYLLTPATAASATTSHRLHMHRHTLVIRWQTYIEVRIRNTQALLSILMYKSNKRVSQT